MAADPVMWRLWICLDGFDLGAALERAARAAGFSVVVAPDARHLPSALGTDGPVVIVLSDAVDGWIRIVGDLHRSRSLLRILLITELADGAGLVTALSAGVDGIARPHDRPDAILGSIVGLCDHGVSLPRAMIKDLVSEVRGGRGHTIRTPDGVVQVTDREWQILQLMIQGLTTREMAVEMYVAVGTVRSHVSALLGKLGVRSRAEAVALMDRR